MQAVFFKIFMAAIPALIPAIVDGVIKYFKDNPEMEARFNDYISKMVGKHVDIANRAALVEIAEQVLEERRKKIISGQGNAETPRPSIGF